MKTVKIIKNLKESDLEIEIRERIRKIVYELKSVETLIDVLMYQGGEKRDYKSVSWVASDIDRHCRKILESADDIRKFSEHLNAEDHDDIE